MAAFSLPKRFSTMDPQHNTLAAPTWSSDIPPENESRPRPSTENSKKNPSFVYSFPAQSLCEGNIPFNAVRNQQHKRQRPEIVYTKIDSRGVASSGLTLSRRQFCVETGIQIKDLRLVDSNLYGPSITARGGTIIVNILDFQAIITPDSVVLFDEETPSYQPQPIRQTLDPNRGPSFMGRFDFTTKFTHRLATSRSQDGSLTDQDSLNFEQASYKTLALTTLLDVILLSLEEELAYLRKSIMDILSELEKHIKTQPLKRLLLYTYQLNSFIGRCSNIQSCLDVLSEDSYTAWKDAKGRNPFLSRKEVDQDSQSDENDELETLLEAYSLENLIEEGKIIIMYVRVTEEMVALTISSNQVYFVSLDLKLAIVSVGLSIGALITGIFGMNLKTGVEEEQWGFVIVTAFLALFATLAVLVGWSQLDKAMTNSSNVKADPRHKKFVHSGSKIEPVAFGSRIPSEEIKNSGHHIDMKRPS